MQDMLLFPYEELYYEINESSQNIYELSEILL